MNKAESTWTCGQWRLLPTLSHVIGELQPDTQHPLSMCSKDKHRNHKCHVFVELCSHLKHVTEYCMSIRICLVAWSDICVQTSSPTSRSRACSRCNVSASFSVTFHDCSEQSPPQVNHSALLCKINDDSSKLEIRAKIGCDRNADTAEVGVGGEACAYPWAWRAERSGNVNS